jgi:hypothetical protein
MPTLHVAFRGANTTLWECGTFQTTVKHASPGEKGQARSQALLPLRLMTAQREKLKMQGEIIIRLMSRFDQRRNAPTGGIAEVSSEVRRALKCLKAIPTYSQSKISKMPSA